MSQLTIADILSDDSETPDCQNCGVCCAYYESVGVDRTEKNFPFLLESDLLQKDEYGNFEMKNENNRCVALSGELGGKVHCSVYEQRPNACRDYVAGAGKCQIARVMSLSKLKK